MKEFGLKQLNTNHRKGAGFTLIELLVVLAIIGLLVSIVLVSVKGAIAKAHDANIKTYMHQLVNAAQLSYNKDGNYSAVCDESDNTLSSNGNFGFLKNALRKENPGNDVTCYESAGGESFAASFALAEYSGKYWCVEAAGPGVEINSPISSFICH